MFQRPHTIFSIYLHTLHLCLKCASSFPHKSYMFYPSYPQTPWNYQVKNTIKLELKVWNSELFSGQNFSLYFVLEHSSLRLRNKYAFRETDTLHSSIISSCLILCCWKCKYNDKHLLQHKQNLNIRISQLYVTWVSPHLGQLVYFQVK